MLSLMMSVGHFSFRNAHGSWFIQALCDQLQKHFQQLDRVDLVRILTAVNRQVAYNKRSATARPETDKKKQVPSFMSMLTREVYLAMTE